MKTNLLTIGIGLLLSAMALPVAAQVVNDDNEDGVVKLNTDRSKYDYVQGQVLVKFKDENRVQVNASRGRFRSSSVSRLTQVLQKYGTEEMEQLLPHENPNRAMSRSRAYNGETIQEKDLSQLYRVKLSENHAQETMQLVDELNTIDEVEFAEPNYLLHTLDDVTIDGITGNNPYDASQWYLEDYGVTKLWLMPIINRTRPVIAIIDTGVDMTHPDLVDNIWTNPGEYQGEKGYDNDHNGFKNDLHGWDFINNTPNVRDYNAHGTHVAGIAAASNNSIGIIGANPRALIMPVTVMQSDGSGDVATIVKGINYAVANGATVLNLSLGTYANSRALRQALENAYSSAVIVAAAGNDGLQILPVCKPREPYGPMFPAAYSFVLGVQATTPEGGLAGFSNYDCDGPNYSSTSTLQDPDGFNYELKAPGTSIYSTIPGGKYRVLQGTSMAAPLVSGAISFLKMVKNYDTQEILWGDLLHSDNIYQAYRMTQRPAELDLIKVMYRERKELSEETEEDYSGDGRIDAGETISLYPVIRTTFGAASNIKMHLEMGDEFEDPNTVQILTGTVDFGLHLDAYGKGVSLNPLKLKVADNVANGRHIKMKFVATCDETNTIYEGHFTMIVDNMRKIYGMITEDMTLDAEHEWLVSSSVAIPEGVTVTIEPGTTINFEYETSISCNGSFIANGTATNKIIFRGLNGRRWYGIRTNSSTIISYAIFEDLGNGNAGIKSMKIDNCIVRGANDYWLNVLNASNSNIQSSNGIISLYTNNGRYNNYANNVMPEWNASTNIGHLEDFSNFIKSNILNTSCDGRNVCIGRKTESVFNDVSDKSETVYIGTGKESIARTQIYELGNGNTFSWYDLSTMPTRPFVEPHGIVWKVCVNGKDAQDEYEDLAPLGVGKQKFEVYFNRPMNKAVAPQISFGVRDPWTQNAVAEDGEGSGWNEEGTIYTAYKTITGKTKSDGVNRIYVRGAEDNEYFEIPYEKTRFNVMINAAGSMATGFAAEAKMGRVDLTWNNEENDFEDAMGFNIYRYQLDNEGHEVNNVRLNQEIVDIETAEYTDYDVTPGDTYYYMYKVLSTDLQEYDVSNVVAATPLTTVNGDADGSGDVKVGDVISTVNYILGENPKPFIFEAADVNTDQNIDVIDVIGIIQMILNQPAGARSLSVEDVAQAVYTIEDGVLYIETPVEIAGLQIQLSLNEKGEMRNEKLAAAADMKGFEVASTWLTENDYRLLAYSFGSKTLTPGKHAIITIGNADITSLRLSDTQGNSVLAVPGDATAVKDAMGSKVINSKGVYNLSGQKIVNSKSSNGTLPKGVYIINGEKVIK